MGSRAIITPHHLTTVQLTRVAGGGRFYAVCHTRATIIIQVVRRGRSSQGARQVERGARTHAFSQSPKDAKLSPLSWRTRVGAFVYCDAPLAAQVSGLVYFLPEKEQTQ